MSQVSTYFLSERLFFIPRISYALSENKNQGLLVYSKSMNWDSLLFDYSGWMEFGPWLSLGLHYSRVCSAPAQSSLIRFWRQNFPGPVFRTNSTNLAVRAGRNSNGLNSVQDSTKPSFCIVEGWDSVGFAWGKGSRRRGRLKSSCITQQVQKNSRLGAFRNYVEIQSKNFRKSPPSYV